MDWLLLAMAVAGLQWLLETALTAKHEHWRRRHAIPPTATPVRRLDSWLFALAVATLLYVQAMLVLFVKEAVLEGGHLDDVACLAMFGGLTGYLWAVARQRWRRLFP